jgi:ribosomal protein S18 acetylase RimI-like enzyme
MPETPVLIRRLLPGEAGLFREIRLEALATAPEAFGSTHAAESARPLEASAERLRNAAVFAAFDGEAVLGMAGFYALDGGKERHKGVLWGMYVRPAGRGAGIAAALVQAVLAHAASEVEQVLLTVVSGNAAARRLYAGLGFVEYGIEPRALLQDEVYFDEILMVKFLQPH